MASSYTAQCPVCGARGTAKRTVEQAFAAMSGHKCDKKYWDAWWYSPENLVKVNAKISEERAKGQAAREAEEKAAAKKAASAKAKREKQEAKAAEVATPKPVRRKTSAKQ